MSKAKLAILKDKISKGMKRPESRGETGNEMEVIDNFLLVIL